MNRAGATTRCADEAETIKAGRQLASRLAPGDLVALEGALGAGKTVLVRGLGEGLGLAAEEISSPSFVLAIDHPEASPPLLHVDLYRLPEGASLEPLGIDEALAGGYIVAVEWGERLPEFWQRAAWRVVIRLEPDDVRSVTIIPPHSEAG
ncbi:MAG: tRNA (adenosine(37)-N6)-threonylcarbamoyltransferase complex ATPase subunit type 1 TsaE [Acidobacteriota bacterium]|nr:MAG: tRNA (adenosine(37)-N6)-threonylcarbamoyltransferase complex ATPase subunit type 1 TsaE [Acidobacteriota bacterium]